MVQRGLRALVRSQQGVAGHDSNEYLRDHEQRVVAARARSPSHGPVDLPASCARDGGRVEHEDSNARERRSGRGPEEGESRGRRSGFGREASNETLRHGDAVVSNPG